MMFLETNNFISFSEAMKTVSKFTFYILQLIFHSLCLSGLIWQVTQISINLFKYDVIKDINVKTPEEVKGDRKTAYVCFYNPEIFDRTKSAKLNSDIFYLPVGEKFEITMSVNETFIRESGTINPPLTGELVTISMYCYQFKIEVYGQLMFSKELNENVDHFLIALGDSDYPFNRNRLIETKIDFEDSGQEFLTKSNSFKIIKMKSPYRDNCVNYPEIGLKDMIDAYANCQSNSTHLSVQKVIWRHEFNYYNYHLSWDDENNCKPSSFKVDCNLRLFFDPSNDS